MPKIDKKKTAMANGYSEAQADALELWNEKDFVLLINDMVRPDGGKKVWIFQKST